MNERDIKTIEDMLHNLIDYVRDCTISGNEYNIDALIKESINTIQAALASQEPVGWKLMPTEPTEEIIIAIQNGIFNDRHCAGLYKKILEAVPSNLQAYINTIWQTPLGYVMATKPELLWGGNNSSIIFRESDGHLIPVYTKMPLNEDAERYNWIRKEFGYRIADALGWSVYPNNDDKLPFDYKIDIARGKVKN
jgi:hypothetical protein